MNCKLAFAVGVVTSFVFSVIITEFSNKSEITIVRKKSAKSGKEK